MSGYTKGPWIQRGMKFDDWGVVRSLETGWIVAKAHAGRLVTDVELNVHRSAGTDPYEANARLIVAAPELLEALKFARAYLVHEPYITDRLDAAISKAESL